MASSSSSSILNSKSSRFSTLKLFKTSRDKDTLKPPPLPPKDHYYSNNRSVGNLSPDSYSMPNSPLSPPYQSQYARRTSPGADPSSSSMSLVSSSASAVSFSPGETAPQSQSSSSSHSKKDKVAGFFKFKRSPKSNSSVKSPPYEEGPPQEDENISLPWNFQHNIHVDEGFAGLPPSWTTSLAEHGFTEEEIAAIQARRTTGTRSPSSQYLYTERPRSPAISSNTTSSNSPNANTPAITRPTPPRTTSLPRQETTPPRQRTPALVLSSSPSSSSLSSHNTTPSKAHPISVARKFSTDPVHARNNSSSSLSISVESNSIANSSMGVAEQAPLDSISPAGAETGAPATPPRRTYHVANGPPAIHSPPPAYTNSTNTNGFPIDRKDRSLFASGSRAEPSSQSSVPPVAPVPATRAGHRHQESTDTTASRTTTGSSNSPPSKRRSKRFTALPPRLSLHKDDSSDLSMWSEALISATLSSSSHELTPNSSTFTHAHQSPSSFTSSSASAKSKSPAGSSSGHSTKSPRTGPLAASQGYNAGRPTTPLKTPPLNLSRPIEKRKDPPARALPPVAVNGDEVVDESISSSRAEAATSAGPSQWARAPETGLTPSSAPSPMWDEIEGIVKLGLSPEVAKWTGPALSESHSPTLPFSPENSAVLPPSKLGNRVSAYRIEDKEGPQEKDKGKLSSGWLDDEDEDEEDATLLRANDGANRDSSRYSSRSSTSTISTVTVRHMSTTAIVGNVSIARRTMANIIDKSRPPALAPEREEKEEGENDSTLLGSPTVAESAAARSRSSLGEPVRQPVSPMSSHFGSSEESGSGSSSSQSYDHQTPITEADSESSLLYYLGPSPDATKTTFSPGPHHHMMVSATDTFGGVAKEEDFDEEDDVDDEEDYDEDDTSEFNHGAGKGINPVPPPVPRPTIVISNAPLHPGPLTALASTTPGTPAQRYRGWLSTVVKPLEQFIDEPIDPREYYDDLHEIAEGESGSVYSAQRTKASSYKLKLPPLTKAKETENQAQGLPTKVALKIVAILPSGSPKLVDLHHELTLLKGLTHPNILSLDALYVDLSEDSLWIRMELMERSLADVIGLVEEGLILSDRTIARVTSDVLEALQYLQANRIAHRDVRSDNLLLNSEGVVKLTDFSNAVQVNEPSLNHGGPVGVLYWQAPEMRSGPYDDLKVDVWSLGATVWEMAQAEPPFADTQQVEDRWPPLDQPENYPAAFHEFLRLCSEPADTRPDAHELIKSAFVQNACGRPVLTHLIMQCNSIEKAIQEREDLEENDSS